MSTNRVLFLAFTGAGLFGLVGTLLALLSKRPL